MLSVGDGSTTAAVAAGQAASTPTPPAPAVASSLVSVTASAAVFPPADSDQAQFETDKRSVYKHPLFPLLALLFERCELATQSSDPTQSSDAFNMDIQAFVQHQERDRKPFLANEPEVDGLMIKAIQVLRIHLLELEKVQELCKDFCNRYITCLKGKMQSENLLRSDYPTHQGQLMGGGLAGYESNNNNNMLSRDESGGSESNSPVPSSAPPQALPSATPYQAQCSETTFTPQQYLQQPTTFNTSTSSSDSNQHMASVVVHGSTPLGQIGISQQLLSDDNNSVHSNPMTPHTPGDDLLDDVDDDCLDDCSSSNDYTGAGGHLLTGGHIGGVGGRSSKTKRGVLPKQATSVMRSWLFQHLVHPYPTEDEKRNIAAQTNLTLLQVNNWFINARRRILQPMLDASSVTAPTSNPNSNNPSCQQQPLSADNNSQTTTDLDVRRRKKRKQLCGNNKRFWPTAMDDDSCSDADRRAENGGEDSYSSAEDDDDDDDMDDSGSQLVIDATVAPSSPPNADPIPVNGHHLIGGNRTRTPTHTAK